MFSKGGTAKGTKGRHPLGVDLVAGAFAGVMVVAAPVQAQPMGGGGQRQEQRGPGNGLVPAYVPVGPVQPNPQADEERSRRARVANGDRRLSPEEKWQLRQLLKTAQ